MPAGAGFEWVESGGELSSRLYALTDSVAHHLKYQTTRTPSAELCDKFNIKGTDLRAIVNYLRRDGQPIGSDGDGYFWARSEDELKDTINQLESRIAGIRGALNGLRLAFKKPPPELF